MAMSDIDAMVPFMEMVKANLVTLMAAVGVAFLALVAKKTDDVPWVVVASIGRAL
jgi:translation initiation factor 2B subunit (eIF-2B alpha/beta/delta family)